MDPNAHLRNELLRDAEKMCEEIGAVPDAVLISGDLTFAGKADEYKFGISWLDELCRRCGAGLSSVFIIPGNHDVLRSVTGRKVVRALHDTIKRADAVAVDGVIAGLLQDPETGPFLYEGITPYNDAVVQFLCDLKPPERTVAQRNLTLSDGSVLRLTGLNSAYVSGAADKPLDLFVDPAAFQITRERGVEHVVLCHHPYEWLRHGQYLKDHLNDVARLHLFGHEHTSRVEVGRDWVRVAASAAHPDRTEGGWEPGYNLIEVDVSEADGVRLLDVKAHVRIWQKRPGEFHAKTDRGMATFDQSIELEAWETPIQTEARPVSTSPDSGETTPSGRDEAEVDPIGAASMDNIREVSIRFFGLTFSQKSAIAGKLDLLEEEDTQQPDFERFRRVLMRAKERDQTEALDREINDVLGVDTESPDRAEEA